MACNCAKCNEGLGPTGCYRWTVDEVELPGGELVAVEADVHVYDGMLQRVVARSMTGESETKTLAEGTVECFTVSDATCDLLDSKWDSWYGSIICTERNRV